MANSGVLKWKGSKGFREKYGWFPQNQIYSLNSLKADCASNADRRIKQYTEEVKQTQAHIQTVLNGLAEKDNELKKSLKTDMRLCKLHLQRIEFFSKELWFYFNKNNPG